MENITTRKDTFFVAKVSKESKTVRFIKISPYNGIFNESEKTDGMAYDTIEQANGVVASMNKIFGLTKTDFYCYLVRNAENSTHVVVNAPEEYAKIISELYNPPTPIEEPTN